MNRNPEFDHPLPWERRAFVTINEAATILGCSRSRLRDAWITGKIEMREPPVGGPRVIAVADVKRLIADTKAIARPSFSGPTAPARVPLQLVVDNT